MKLVLISLVVTAALAFVGCSDEGESRSDSEPSTGAEAKTEANGEPTPSGTSTTPTPAIGRPRATVPLAKAVDDMNRVVEERDCEEFHKNLDAIAVVFGSLEYGTEECNADRRRLADVGWTFKRSQEFGTAGLAEAPVRFLLDRVAVFVLYDGRYRFLEHYNREPQIGTQPSPRAEPEEVVRTFINGVLEGDCSQVEPILHPEGTLTAPFEGDVQAGCVSVVDGVLFAPSLKESAEAEPELLGATRDFAFYGVPTAKAYFTIVLGTEPNIPGGSPKVMVIDVVPSTQV